jgi:hypothetical protein
MKKQDLTNYGDQELSLLVMNTEPLYKVFMTSVRMGKFHFILDHVSELFTFTNEQAGDLGLTWEDEFLEYEEESRSTTQIKASQPKPKRIEDNEELTKKILNALDAWAIQFKIMGFPYETPRYSQLMIHNGFNNVVDKFDLVSTQTERLFHHLNLTDEENKFLSNMEFNDRWYQYRDMRNKFLADNHPTIDLR